MPQASTAPISTLSPMGTPAIIPTANSMGFHPKPQVKVEAGTPTSLPGSSRHRGQPALQHVPHPGHRHGEQPRAQQHLGPSWPLHPPATCAWR